MSIDRLLRCDLLPDRHLLPDGYGLGAGTGIALAISDGVGNVEDTDTGKDMSRILVGRVGSTIAKVPVPKTGVRTSVREDRGIGKEDGLVGIGVEGRPDKIDIRIGVSGSLPLRSPALAAGTRAERLVYPGGGLIDRIPYLDSGLVDRSTRIPG